MGLWRSRPESTSSSDASPSARSSPVAWGVGAIFLSGLYVLSPMPLAWCVSKLGMLDNPGVQAVFDVVYAPLKWAFDHVSWVHDF